MSKKATEFQKKEMSKMYRGKEIFKPLNTGWIDEHVACVREWVANIFFYRKGDRVIMIDAGYNYDRLEEKMGWLGLDPKAIKHILITHQDTDQVGAVEADSLGLFRDATLYIGETENRYLTGEKRRWVIHQRTYRSRLRLLARRFVRGAFSGKAEYQIGLWHPRKLRPRPSVEAYRQAANGAVSAAHLPLCALRQLQNL